MITEKLVELVNLWNNSAALHGERLHLVPLSPEEVAVIKTVSGESWESLLVGSVAAASDYINKMIVEYGYSQL